jgi:signal transduction histidine kinase
MLKEAQLQRAPEKTMTEVDLLLAEIDRLSALVDDLLDVTRIQQGRVRFDLQPVSLHGLLSGVVDVLRHEVERKGLTLRYDPPDRELRVSADPQRLRQVFVNIVGNAIKYTEKGEVSLRHEVRGNNVATMVTDTGIGMSPEDREQLFSKFYRIRTTETQKISGTGLGLWITKQIIEHLGGKIYTDSMKERGSQFTVLLPLLAEGAATTSGADARQRNRK